MREVKEISALITERSADIRVNNINFYPGVNAPGFSFEGVKMGETIAAVSTALMSSGIGIVRISGDTALETAQKIFFSISKKKLSEMKGYTAAYGTVSNGGEKIDECIATVFKRPKSYTGEDVVELSCHGGIVAVKKVLKAALDNGARQAQAGEFTKRAFLNGKVDLTQAEAVMDLIGAQGETALRAAFSQHEGALYKKIGKIKQQLVDISADITAWIDFPDEGVPSLEPENLKNNLSQAKKVLEDLKKNYNKGKIIKNGVETAIAGKPNVGKSTLMNALSGYEKSIVTEIAGTTRDVVEESVNFAGLTLRLWDTAGLRRTDDPVEKIGVERAKQKLESAQLILAVFDGSQELSETDKELINDIKDRNSVAVINKCDLPQRIDKEYIRNNVKHIVELSANNGYGLDLLEKEIIEITKTNTFDPAAAMIANERQLECVNKSLDGVNSALYAVESGITLDAVSVGVEDAVSALCELTGEKASEEIIDKVFDKFCIGK